MIEQRRRYLRTHIHWLSCALTHKRTRTHANTHTHFRHTDMRTIHELINVIKEQHVALKCIFIYKSTNQILP